MKISIAFHEEKNIIFIIDNKIFSFIKKLNYKFQSYRYIIFELHLNLQSSKTKIYINNDCEISLIDRQFLKKMILELKILIMILFILIRNFKIQSHASLKYVLLDVWISSIKFKKLIIANIKRKIHLMNNLRINILMSFNVFIFENMMIDYIEKKLRIFNYQETSTSINCTSIDHQINKVIQTKFKITLSSFFVIEVFIQIRDVSNLLLRDYLFYLKISMKLKLKKKTSSLT